MSGNVGKRQVASRGSDPQTQPSMVDAIAREFIRNFSFNSYKMGNQGFQTLLFQLFGYAGHGKSSFINSCKIVWDNSAYNNYTKASGSYGGDTMDRKTYHLTENVIMVDNRGCSTMRSYEKGEIFAQLANLIPLNTKVDWSPGFKLADRIVESEHLVKSSDFISPIFVYSVAYRPNPIELQELREILSTCREMTGVEATVVLTHKMKGDVTRAEAMFRDMGVVNVYSLENYTPNNQSRSAEVQDSVMLFLYGVVKDAEFRVSYPRNPQDEITERKIFVLNYIHRRELEVHRQKLEAQKATENAGLEQTMKTRREEAEKEQKKEAQEFKEQMRKLEEDFERQRLYDQYKHEQKLTGIQRRGRST